jgi:hypothetical protein
MSSLRAKFTLPAVILAGGLLALSAAIALGPLNPPTGAVTSTLKPLAEIEPRIAINATNTPGDNDATPSLFKITTPGSYYLTGNITGVSGKRGIEITASGVTLDLNGFELVGVTGSQDGIVSTGTLQSNITLLNGVIRNWGTPGVNLSNVEGGRVENLTVASNGGIGIALGPVAIVSKCISRNNAGSGILTASTSTVVNCSASANTSNGFTLGSGCSISSCAANDNTDDGFNVGSTCSLTNCSALSNIQRGINAGVGSTITNCSVLGNSGSAGLSVGTGSTIVNCNVRQSANIGIFTGSQSTITNSTASLNGSIGISLGNDCTVESCTSIANSIGIFSNRNGTILNSTINSSTSGPGITTPNEGLRVQGCTISANATFGVFSDTFTNTSDVTVASCTIRDNGSGGVSSEANTQIIGCTVNANGSTVASPGIKVTDGSSVIDSSANNNTAGGILAGSGATVSRCNAYQNTGNGISVGGSSSVLDSTARLNTLDGILFSFRCQVRGNNSASNTLAQFHATDTDNRIEANTAVSGARGFDVDLAGNLLTRNSSTNATTNWDIVAGNVCFVINATTSAAISGSAGGTAPGSTDPNANFSY